MDLFMGSALACVSFWNMRNEDNSFLKIRRNDDEQLIRWMFNGNIRKIKLFLKKKINYIKYEKKLYFCTLQT